MIIEIIEKLKKSQEKIVVDELIQYIGHNPERLKELVDCFLQEDMRTSQVASWPLGKISNSQPDLFRPYHRPLIDALVQKQRHNAIRRNVVRIYQFIEIPEEFEAEIFDICVKFISNANEPIAVKAFSIRVCERIIEKYPELANELIQIIKASINGWGSALENRGNKFLKKWNKVSK